MFIYPIEITWPALSIESKDYLDVGRCLKLTRDTHLDSQVEQYIQFIYTHTVKFSTQNALLSKRAVWFSTRNVNGSVMYCKVCTVCPKIHGNSVTILTNLPLPG